MQPNPKQIYIGIEARDAALRGVEKVYEAVSATLGPRSANVAIARPFGRPAVVHDGVTVAKEVLPLKDPVENVGAEFAVEAADKTNAIGDGTTTATVLMRNIAKGAHTYIVAGARPMALRAGIESATKLIAATITKQSKPIDKVEDVRLIATVSAQDEEIGGMVADAYEQLGKEGIMSVEESRGTESFLEVKTGMEFDRGYKNPYFITDGLLGEANIDNPYILVTDSALRSLDQVAPVFEKLFNEGVKNLVIIADDIDGEALAFILANHIKHTGGFSALAIQAPSFGDKRGEMLRDIAIVTGATLISEATGMALTAESITKDLLGRASRVSSTQNSTLIVEGGGPEEDIKKRAEELKAKAESLDTGAFDREKLMERYAKLQSGVAVLTIGARSESEVKEKKERAIDAISAAKAALSDGVVPGGGITLATSAFVAQAELMKDPRANERDWASGVKLVAEACRAPFNKLMENAGFDAGEQWANLQREALGWGFDVVSGQKVDMIKAGIMDPSLVVRSALENASSNAVMLATTDVIIVEQVPEVSNA